MGVIQRREVWHRRVDALDYPEINKRFSDFKQITHFDDIPFERASTAG
jgi:hypothetical protein